MAFGSGDVSSATLSPIKTAADLFPASQIIAVCMDIIKVPWEVMFAGAGDLCTRIVAGRLSGKPIPTDDQELEMTWDAVRGPISKTDWVRIKAAYQSGREQLIESSKVNRHVRPARGYNLHAGPELTFPRCCSLLASVCRAIETR